MPEGLSCCNTLRYGITPKELSWGGFDKRSTLLLSRKNGEVLYFTIGTRTKPEISKDDFLEWTDFFDERI